MSVEKNPNDFIEWTLTDKGLVGTVAAKDGQIYRLGPEENISGVSFKEKNIEGVNLSGATLENTNFTMSVLNRGFLAGSKMQGVVFDRAFLIEADLSFSFGQMSVFLGANLSDAKIKDSDLRYAKLDGAICSGADFSGCNLRHAICRAADFRGANLTNAEISAADFTGAYWGGTKISGIKIEPNSGTKYEQYDFGQVRNILNISDQRFEFLVFSNALEVRENDTLRVVFSDFSPRTQHIPVWALENMKIALKD